MNNYIYHGSQGLITLPERNVQTFPSGLVRIDRVYACRKTLADRFRRDLAVGNPLPFDDGAPAIDGAFIFPDPQETIRDDGFTEFRVSAYGRTNTDGNGTLDSEIVSISRNYQRVINVGLESERIISWSIIERYIVDLFIQTFIIAKETANSQIIIPDIKLNERRISFRIFGTRPGIIRGIDLIWERSIEAISRRNFGSWDEITVSYKLIPRDNPNTFSFRDLA
jgi:hypothetical protein